MVYYVYECVLMSVYVCCGLILSLVSIFPSALNSLSSINKLKDKYIVYKEEDA